MLTREDAIKEFSKIDKEATRWSAFGMQYLQFINRIYDDFESRSCFNCEHLSKDLSQMSPFCNKHNFWLTDESSKILTCKSYKTRSK